MAERTLVPDERAVGAYYDALPLPARVVGRTLDALARETLEGAAAGIKYGVPFYALRAPVCYVSAAQRHVTFGLLEGARVRDDSGLLVGTGRTPIRKATFRLDEHVPEDVVRAWLRDARRLDAEAP